MAGGNTPFVMGTYVPGRRNIDAAGRRMRAVGGLLLLGVAAGGFLALSAPGLPSVYRFSLFFILFPSVWLLLEALVGFSVLRGMAQSGGGHARRGDPKDPVILDRRSANYLMLAAFFLALILSAILSR